MLKAITFLIISFLMLDFSGVRSCSDQQKKSDQPVVENPNNNSSELKELAGGSQSAVEEPFIAVIRDDQTYARLRNLEPQLPKVEPDFFNLNVVVAAFLGTRNTGGYQIEITRSGGDIRVGEKAPPKGAMTIQVITSPFKVVSFQPNGSTAVVVSTEGIHRNAQIYQVTTGNFTLSGGFTGRSESFQLRGRIEVTRLGELITVGFGLTSSGGSRERGLRGFETGLLNKDEIVFEKVSHGSLIDPPSGELTVNGKFLEKNRLSLELKAKPINVPEGYGGSGSIEAQMIAASAN